MEEILASIRRIISEDDVPTEEAAAEPPAAEAEPEPVIEAQAPATPVVEAPPPVVVAPEPTPQPVVAAAPEPEDDVLELTDKVESLGDLDLYTPPAAAAVSVEPVADATPEPIHVDTGELVSSPAATAAAAAFGHLSSSMMMPQNGRSLEDVVRELLRPLLKQWLDEHLPRVVEETVRAEVERISRGGRAG